MSFDTKVPQGLLGSEIKRKMVASPNLDEKPSIAYNSPDYDPTQAPPYLMDPYSQEVDSQDNISINQTLTSTPSFPITKLVIPTRTDSLASGFPFHQRLYDYRVSHDEWHLFTHEIVKAASLTIQEDWVAWTAGISTGVLSTGILVFGGPFAGYYTGRSVHRKKVVEKVKDGLMHEGSLRATLHKWNDQSFRGKGFQAWLELPSVKGEVNGENDQEESNKKCSKKEKNLKKKEQRRFRIIIIPNDAPMGMLMSSQESTWSLGNVQSNQRSGIAEAPDTEQRQPAVAELPS
ncbi:uncharacterized protein EAF02_006057 [Botrytis sinoallii]|uniref:uncharacterized protein n=1 Tax=Botrytis sinoallii TaxID=1463999 RepID=UPI0019023945|nr:uncharacterized protein EAF02_006057 [Botrytis sinoallii]KAF7882694.1 hypothetical protein EAF02_006057 [Botrytis sinoallii]